MEHAAEPQAAGPAVIQVEDEKFRHAHNLCLQNKQRLLRIMPQLHETITRFVELKTDFTPVAKASSETDENEKLGNDTATSFGSVGDEEVARILLLTLQLREVHQDILHSSFQATAALEPIRSRVEDAHLQLSNLHYERDMLCREISQMQLYRAADLDALAGECSLDVTADGQNSVGADQAQDPSSAEDVNMDAHAREVVADHLNGNEAASVREDGEVVAEVDTVQNNLLGPVLGEMQRGDPDADYEQAVRNLEEELKERQKLSQEIEFVQAELGRETELVSQETESLRRLPCQIKAIVASIQPLREFFQSDSRVTGDLQSAGRIPNSNSGVMREALPVSPGRASYSTREERLALNRLPLPLYVLAREAIAYRDNFGNGLSMEVLTDEIPGAPEDQPHGGGSSAGRGPAEHAPVTTKASTGDFEALMVLHSASPGYVQLHIHDDGDYASVGEAGMPSPRTLRKRRRTSNHTGNLEFGHGAEQIHDATACAAVSLNFRFLPALGIVTVSCPQGRSLYGISTEELCLLYPGDYGAVSPNPSHSHLLDGTFEFRRELTKDSGMPFLWANLLCGMRFRGALLQPVGRVTSSAEEVGEWLPTAADYPTHLRFRDMFHALKRRTIAICCLHKQLNELVATRLPVQWREAGLTEATQARLKKFVVSPTGVHERDGARNGLPRNCGTLASLEVEHPGGANVVALVSIRPDYPLAMGRFQLRDGAPNGRMGMSVAELRDMEYEVNVRGDRFPVLACHGRMGAGGVSGKRGLCGSPHSGEGGKGDEDGGCIWGEDSERGVAETVPGADEMILGKQVLKLLACVDAMVSVKQAEVDGGGPTAECGVNSGGGSQGKTAPAGPAARQRRGRTRSALGRK